MAERGVLLHLGVLVVGEVPRLVQDGVGDADLADVVQRRQRGDQVDPLRRQHPPVGGLRRQGRGQQPDVLLGAAGVPAGIDVAGRGQRRQRLDDQLLRLLAAVVLGVGAAPFGDQLRAHRGDGADGQPEQADDRRDDDAVGGVQGAGAEPDQRGGGDRRRRAPHRSERQDQRDGGHRHQQRRRQLDQIGELGPRAGPGRRAGCRRRWRAVRRRGSAGRARWPRRRARRGPWRRRRRPVGRPCPEPSVRPGRRRPRGAGRCVPGRAAAPAAGPSASRITSRSPSLQAQRAVVGLIEVSVRGRRRCTAARPSDG